MSRLAIIRSFFPRTLIVLSWIVVGCGQSQNDRFKAKIDAFYLGASDSIDLRGWMTLSEKQLEQLVELEDLRKLRLDGTDASDDTIRRLSGLAQIEFLSLSDTRITDAALPHIAKMSTLKELVIDTTRVTDSGLVHLAKLPQLTALSLWNCFITDRGCQSMCKLVSLKRLSLDGTQVTDRGLMRLASIESLDRLSVWNARNVTDRGIAEIRRIRPRAHFISVVGKETAYQCERKEFRLCQPHGRLNSQDTRISLTHNGIASRI